MSVETNVLVERFRGFQPVVVDVETGGFEAKTDGRGRLAEPRGGDGPPHPPL